MALQALKEVTDWAEGMNCSHTYLMDGDKALGYMKWHTGPAEYFKNPMTLDKRRRKFEVLKVNPFTDYAPKQEKDPNIVEVKGSNGTVYSVDKINRTCTCPSSRFRKGECKHIKEVCK